MMCLRAHLRIRAQNHSAKVSEASRMEQVDRTDLKLSKYRYFAAVRVSGFMSLLGALERYSPVSPIMFLQLYVF